MGWWIALGVLLLILSLLLIPWFVVSEYVSDTPVVLYVRWLFFKFPLDFKKITASSEKKKKRAPRKKKMPPKTSPKPKKASLSPEQFVDLLGEIPIYWDSVKPGLRTLLGSIKFTRLRLHVVVANEDAAQTALTYGRLSAVIYNLYRLIAPAVADRKTTVQISPTFLEDSGRVACYVTLRFVPLIGLAGLLRAGFAGLFTFLRLKKRKRPPKSHTKTHSPSHKKTASV